MKILLTGGGTGGHFYPIIAVSSALNAIAEQEKIANLELIFMSENPYDKNLLLQNNILFKKIRAGKIRRYFSFLNITDVFKTFLGALKALWTIYLNFPDVIFSKGGYASFPVVLAARVFGIPLIIHESDSIPGKVNSWTGKFAKRIAVSFAQTSAYFNKEKTAVSGNPVRKDFFTLPELRAKEFLSLEENLPVIFVIGGSQGSKNINDNFLDIVPELLKKYQIIHQCGANNLKETEGRISILLEKSRYKSRYHLFDYMNLDYLTMAYAAADLVVSRAGSGSIFEIAAAAKPSILIPLGNSAQDHQKENARAYAAAGAANIIEETNLSPHVLQSEIERLLGNEDLLKKMGEAAKKFAKPDAAEKIAREIITLALEHA